MDRKRKRVRVHGEADGTGACEWTFHADQRLVGVSAGPGAVARVSLVAAGERHVQIREALETATVGKLVALESGRSVLQPPQGGIGEFYVLVPRHATSETISPGICLFNAAKMDVEDIPIPEEEQSTVGPPGMIEGVFVDGDMGNAVVLVERYEFDETSDWWRLWGWRRRRDRGTRRASEWTVKDAVVTAPRHSHCAWDARFFTSPVFGPSLQLVVVVSSPEDLHFTLETRLVAVDDDWRLLHSHQMRVAISSSQSSIVDAKIWLSPSLRWAVLVDSGGMRLACVPLDPFEVDMGWSLLPHSTKVFEVPVGDIAWHGDVFAVLLADSSLHFLKLPHGRNESLSTLDIASDRVNTIVSFSTLVKEVMPSNASWSRLLWIPANQWLVASCGATAMRIIVSVEDLSGPLSTSSRVPSQDLPQQETKENPGVSMHRRRWRLPSRREQEAIDSRSCAAIGSPAFPTTDISEMFYSTRAILFAGRTSTINAAFTLFGILLQRLLRQLGLLRDDTPSLHFSSCEDFPIQVGIMEMLLAQVMTATCPDVQSTATRIIQAPAFSSQRARQSYYLHEAHGIARGRSNLTQHRHFIRCVTNTLSDSSTSCGLELDSIAQCVHQPSESIDVVSEGAQLLRDIERHMTTSGKCPPALRLRAVITLFTIASKLCGISRPLLAVPALLRAISAANRGKAQATVLGEGFIERFVSTAPFASVFAEQAEGRSHLVDGLRGLAVRSGAVATFIDYCAARDDMKLLELLHSAKKRKENEWTDQIISREVTGQAIAQLESLLRSTPLLSRLRKLEAPSKAWTTAVNQDNTAFDAFVRLVFTTTDTVRLSGDITESHLTSASTGYVFDAYEVELRRKVFKLSWVVMHHVRQWAMGSYGADWSERLAELASGLFLFDQLWSVGAASRDALKILHESLFDPKQQGTIHGRVTGLRQSTRGDTLPRPDDLLRRVLHTLAALLWSFWTRERASICKAAIDQYRLDASQHQDESAFKLGRMAAACALHLKTLALFRDAKEEDEIVSTKLFFLEAAAEHHPSAAFIVISWAFSPSTINTRHLRRFRGIQIRLASLYTANRDEEHMDRARDQLRRAVQQSSSVSRSPDAVLDAFGTCCCDANFQRVVWALQQRRFHAFSTATAPTEQKLPIRKAVQARHSSVEGVVSRHEVVSLLQAQRQEIENQMQRLRSPAGATTAGRTMEAVSARINQEAVVTEAMARSPASGTTPFFTSARVLEVRDLNPRYRSHDNLKTKSEAFDTQAINRSAMMQKGSSTHNVLKLLQLRKNDIAETKRHQSSSQMTRVPIGKPLATGVEAENEATLASEGRPIPRKREQERILPLRRDHAETAELLLLTASKWKATKTVPLSRRRFRLAIPPAASPVPKKEQSPPEYSSCAVQCTEMRTTSMQTEEIDRSAKETRQQPPPAPASVASVGTQHHAPELPPPAAAPPASSITSRFPVFVDLEDPTAGKFLHVARMKHSKRPSLQEANRVRVVYATPHTELAETLCEQSASDAYTGSDVGAPRDDARRAQELAQMQIQERRRLAYRTHYATSKIATDRPHASGVDSFVSLKTEMERMKAKLLELEDCARDLDEDFKVSHHRLEKMGKFRGEESRPVLDEVDDVIETTITSDARPGIPTHSTLSTKAARDMDSARHLLAQIERLTTAEP